MTDHCPLTTDSCSLFPDLGPTIEERIKEIDLEIERLLYSGQVAGVSLSDDEKRILHSIRYRRGSANAISIRELQARINAPMSDRAIKAVVHELRVTYRLPIGSNKGTPNGYFIMVSPEDRAILYNQILDQVRAELEVLRATNQQHEALRMLGQLQLEMQTSKEAA